MQPIAAKDWNRPKWAVLLVDDEEVILTSLSEYLKRDFFNVQTASNGRQVLSLLQSVIFDIVITDLAMEGMSGIELLSEIKKLYPRTSVFILTGRGNMDSAIEALRLGADDYLLKPCDTDELIVRMHRCLEKQDTLRRLKIYEEFLPVCMYCKKIRDDTVGEKGKGEWMEPEEYLVRHRGIRMTHGICPRCCEHIDILIE
jgi:DNA-binding response OmpR family regulator